MSTPDPYAQDDAAYVMGALTPADRRDYEAHLAGCARCSAAVAELSGMPGLLGLVPAAQVTGARLPDTLPPGPVPDAAPPGPVPDAAPPGPVPDAAPPGPVPDAAPPGPVPDAVSPGPVPDTLLPGLVRAARRARRRRTAATTAAAVAAACLVGGVAVAATGSRHGGPAAGKGSAVVTTLAPLRPVPVHATVRLQPASWGTSLRVTCTYEGSRAPAAGSPAWTYRLVVVPTGGRAPQLVADWRTLPDREVVADGSTALALRDVASVQLQLGDGTVLLEGRPS